MTDCGFCEHHKPNPYSMSVHGGYCCMKPFGRKCPKHYVFPCGQIYDAQLYDHSLYTSEEIWKDATDYTGPEKVRVKKSHKIEWIPNKNQQIESKRPTDHLSYWSIDY